MDTKKISNNNAKECRGFATRFDSILRNTFNQSSAILSRVTNAKDYSGVWEVGSGAELATRMLSVGVMHKGATYFANDLAKEATKVNAEDSKKSNLALNSEIKYEQVERFESVDVSEYTEKKNKGLEREHFIQETKNEKLGYSAKVYDFYLSILSLNLINNLQKSANRRISRDAKQCRGKIYSGLKYHKM